MSNKVKFDLNQYIKDRLINGLKRNAAAIWNMEHEIIMKRYKPKTNKNKKTWDAE